MVHALCTVIGPFTAVLNDQELQRVYYRILRPPPLLIGTSAGFYLSVYIELEKGIWMDDRGALTTLKGYLAIAFATLNFDRRDECKEHPKNRLYVCRVQ